MRWFVSKTSDKYFDFIPEHTVFDLIFIDGFHTKEQVKRDFENSLRCLNQNGFIVIHDTYPWTNREHGYREKQKQWWGDVYKFAFETEPLPQDWFLHLRFRQRMHGSMEDRQRPVDNATAGGGLRILPEQQTPVANQGLRGLKILVSLL